MSATFELSEAAKAHIADVSAANEPDKSLFIIQQQAPGTFRVQCLNGVLHQFDVFGVMKQADLHENEGVDSFTQGVLDHIRNCAGRSEPKSHQILQNANSPQLFIMEIVW